jgi:cell division initiation protein
VRITPLDVRNHVFPRRMNGYDREEVDTFLRMVSGDYEIAMRELQSAREKIGQLEQRVSELLANERLLQETLTTAQHLSKDLKQTAMKEAEMMISEAEIQGEKVLDAAHRRAARIAEDLREMKLLRGRVAAALRATLEHHLQLVEHLSQDPSGDDPGMESGSMRSCAAASRAAALKGTDPFPALAPRRALSRLALPPATPRFPPPSSRGISMPVYEYACEKCKHEFEAEQRISDDRSAPARSAARAR